MSPSSLPPQTLLARRYRLERPLGEGGMGVVWEAIDVQTGEHVAIKLLKTFAREPRNIRRFLREARAAMAVHHPNVVRIREVITDEAGSPAMVMDLLRGETLASLLTRERGLDLGRFVRIFLPVVSAVGTAHALGIVHRDLKPENIFLTDRGQGKEPGVLVLDFGIAKMTAEGGEAAHTGALTTTGAMLGTPLYMSPEQVLGEKDVDHRSDVWSLGIIMYECLSGTRAVTGDNIFQLIRVVAEASFKPLSEAAPQLPKEIADLSAKMLKLDKLQRVQDLREVQAVLERFSDVKTEVFAAPTKRTDSISVDESEGALGSTDSRGDGAPTHSRGNKLAMMVWVALLAIPVAIIVSIIVVSSAGRREHPGDSTLAMPQGSASTPQHSPTPPTNDRALSPPTATELAVTPKPVATGSSSGSASATASIKSNKPPSPPSTKPATTVVASTSSTASATTTKATSLPGGVAPEAPF